MVYHGPRAAREPSLIHAGAPASEQAEEIPAFELRALAGRASARAYLAMAGQNVEDLAKIDPEFEAVWNHICILDLTKAN